MMNLGKLPEFVKYYRKRHNYTLVDMAYHMGVSHTIIHRIETKKANLQLKTVFQLCYRMNVSPADVMPTLDELTTSGYTLIE